MLHILLMLSRVASVSLVGALLLVLVLLQQQLLLFENLDLVWILHRRRSLCIWRWISDYDDILTSSEIFFVVVSLIFKIKLLYLAQVSFRCQGMINHIDVRILRELLTDYLAILMVCARVLVVYLNILSSHLRIFFAAITAIPIPGLPLRVSCRGLLWLSKLRIWLSSCTSRVLLVMLG